MSKITDREPKHWHDADGNHRMPDPRRLAAPQPIAGTHEMSTPPGKAVICHGDPDLAAYWDHLDEHDRAVPQRRPRDSAQVKALFDQAENGERVTGMAHELITVLRRAGQ